MMLADVATAAEIMVAAGTLALAAVTARLASHARRGIAVQERQLVALQRPFAFPFVTEEWLRDATALNPMLPIKNGGSGPAFNVRGSIYWRGGAGGNAAIVQTALAAGESDLVRIEGVGIQVDFTNARGYLRYDDSTGREWQTHFRYAGTVGLVVGGTLRVDVLASGTTEELGEPQYNNEEWVNAPSDVRSRWA